MKKKRLLLIVACVCLIVCAYLVGASVFGSEVGLDNFAQTKKSVPAFTDVTTEDWFNSYVQAVAERGLMVGDSATTFNPLGKVTLAETITIASRLHSIYYTGNENFKQSEVWYQVYLDYAKEKGIFVPEAADYNRQAARGEFAQIIRSAFPAEALTEINDISDDEIPDVSMRASHAEAVYTLYRAGVLTGNDDMGTFAPNTTIRRSEVAAIISRMVEPEERIQFDLSEEEADREDDVEVDTEEREEEPLPEIEIDGPAFVVDTKEAKAGQEQVAVTISVRNNPGISALAMHLSYDRDLTLTKIVYNEQLSGETMLPQTMKNPVKLIWLNPFEDVTDDFVLATAYFTVSPTAATGSRQIAITYNPDDVFELSEENVHFEVVQGAIYVTK